MRNPIRHALPAALVALALAQAPAAYAQASASPYTSGTRYDLMHRVTGTIAPDPDGAGGLHHPTTRNTYDAAGRLIKIETGELSAWQSEAVAPSAWTGFSVFRKLDTQYDAMGRKLRDTLSSGAGVAQTVTQYSYDAMGHPECTAVRMNAADFASPPASACTQGTGGADRITRKVYDAAGQLIQIREGVGTAIEAAEATFRYTANGKRDQVIDGNGNRATLSYDGLDRQIGWTFPSPTRATAYDDTSQATALASAGAVNGNDYEAYAYDPNGNRLTLRKRDGRLICGRFDALNRADAKFYLSAGSALDLCRTSSPSGADAVYYGYDARGHQTYARFGSTSGQGITNVWDAFGALTSASTNMGGVTRTLSYQYDADGARTRITHPDMEWFQQDHDGLGRPTMLSRQGVPGLALLVYDATGLPFVMGLGNGYNRFFGYDAVQRPTSFSQDLAGTAADASWSFPRNAAGQIASVTRDNDAYAWTGHYAVQRAYTTNGLNQYSAAGGTALAYDTNGNLISETTAGVTKTYTYDIENRLVATSAGAALSYDPLGRLYRVSLGANTTTFLNDGNALVAEYDATGTLTRRYVHGDGADVPLVQYNGADPNQIRFLYADQQGSIVAASYGAGAVSSINTYDEYGIPGATNEGRFQYTGQAWLAELGMYYYKARIYSPTLGRFLQTDPVGYADQYNLYAYVGDDPINATDPAGTDTVTSCQGVSVTCATTAQTGRRFSGPAALKDANLAVAPENAALTASTGHEYGNIFDKSSDGSVTVSVSVSDGSSTSVSHSMDYLYDNTDNPAGDQHVHPTPEPGRSYGGQTLSIGDVNTADNRSTMLGRSFNRTVVDGETGRIVSMDGRPGATQQNSDGSWQRPSSDSTSAQARVIGRIPAIPYHPAQ